AAATVRTDPEDCPPEQVEDPETRDKMATKRLVGRGRAVALVLLWGLLPGDPARAASLLRQCRRECRDEIASCVASGARKGTCRREILTRCKEGGLAVCLTPGESSLVGGLSAPSSLVATVTGSHSVGLTWIDTNTRGTGDTVERSLAPTSGFATIGTTPKDVNAYSDSSGLASSTTYYYRVRAIGRKGSASPYSNVASVTTPPAADTTPPSVPTGVAASAVSCGQVNVSWSQATDSGGSGLKGYNVY